jgi:hypothetical protein
MRVGLAGAMIVVIVDVDDCLPVLAVISPLNNLPLPVAFLSR